MKVALAQIENLEEIAKLFDRYRVFYQQLSDLEAARLFIRDRLHQQDSIILIATVEDRIGGFTQLYPSFSSVAMKPILILNDLFVAQPYRQQGIAKSLMAAAATFGREAGAIRIELSTQSSNTIAQSLYQSLGYIKNEEFYQYALAL
jgi:ribosomal protein S18 acetylase RimI-like enzyme